MPRDGILGDSVSDLGKGSAGPDRSKPEITFRAPEVEDGSEVWRLIQDINALDDNSMYCNLLQCSHFSETCGLAEMDGEIVGWESGYRPPSDPDTLFVWQVAVHPKARGQGVAKRLILWVLGQQQNRDVRFLHSTITASNKASWALFTSIAAAYDADMDRDAHFEEELHFDGEAKTEHLVQIGPIRHRRLKQVA